MKGRKTGVRPAALGLCSCVLILILAFSSQPYREQSIQPFLQRTLSAEQAKRVLPDVHIRYNGKTYSRETNPYGLIEFLFRKGAHLFLYGLFAVVTALALQPYRKRTGAWSVAMLSLAAVLLVALLDEWNQGRSSARTPAREDVILDLAGGLLGLAVLSGIRHLFRRFPRNETPS